MWQAQEGKTNINGDVDTPSEGKHKKRSLEKEKNKCSSFEFYF